MKGFSFLFFLWVLVLPLFSLEAPGEDEKAATGDDEDVITVEAARIRRDSRGGQKTVITREDWNRSGARTVGEVLSLSPGVTVRRTGTFLDTALVSIRGAGGRQVLVLQDGIPLNSGKGDGVNMNSLSLEGIEAIEVIRGGGSAVYGEGAFGGVVNILSSRAKEDGPAGHFSLSGASYGSWSAGGEVRGPFPGNHGLGGRLSLEGRGTEGNYEYSDPRGGMTRTNSGGWALNSGGALNWDLFQDKKHNISLKGEFYASRRGIPGVMEFLTPKAELEEMRMLFSSGYRCEGLSGLFSDAEMSWQYRDSHFSNPDASAEDEHESQRLAGREELGMVIFPWIFRLEPRMGLEVSRESLESTNLRSQGGITLPGQAEQWDFSLYSRCEAEAGDFSLTPALRWDYSYSSYKGWLNRRAQKISWGLAGLWSPGQIPWMTLKANAGTAFHAPGFDDLFWSSGAYASGNPDLLPEESFSWDLGLSFESYSPVLKGLKFSLVYFQSFTKNLIQWLPGPGGVWRPGNIGQAENQGLEAELDWQIAFGRKENMNLEIRGAYTWMEALIQSPGSINRGNQLPFRPVHSGQGRLGLGYKKQSLSIEAHFMGYRYLNGANTKSLEGFVTLDSILRLAFPKGFYALLVCRNMGNKMYVDQLGYPVPGREFSLKGGFEF